MKKGTGRTAARAAAKVLRTSTSTTARKASGHTYPSPSNKSIRNAAHGRHPVLLLRSNPDRIIYTFIWF